MFKWDNIGITPYMSVVNADIAINGLTYKAAQDITHDEWRAWILDSIIQGMSPEEAIEIYSDDYKKYMYIALVDKDIVEAMRDTIKLKLMSRVASIASGSQYSTSKLPSGNIDKHALGMEKAIINDYKWLLERMDPKFAKSNNTNIDIGMNRLNINVPAKSPRGDT